MNVSLSPAVTLLTSPLAGNQATPTTATGAGATAASLVKLTVNGQIRQLKEEGQTLSQISVDVDLSISAVGNDLLINMPRMPAVTQTPRPSTFPGISLSA